MTLERREPLKRGAPLRRTPIKRTPMRRTERREARAERRRAIEFSEKTKRRAANRYNGRCACCGGRIDQYHHRKMRSAGGLGTFENCLPVCDPCHRRIHAEVGWAFRHGLLVRRGHDPRRIDAHERCGPTCPLDHVGESVGGP